ncbi:MAG: trypsin-like peptidase domain-containing protein [Acidobacteriota bacterium]
MQLPLRHASALFAPRPRRLWVALLMAFVLAPSVAVAQDDLKVLAKKAEGSVALLEVLDAAGTSVGNGTGFFIEGGLLVTNRHVVDGVVSLRAVLADGRVLDVVGIRSSTEADDLALLEVSFDGDPPPPLDLWRGSVEVGERVAVLGSPKGFAGTLSTGIVSALRPDGIDSGDGAGTTGNPLFQITASISPGSSGSPVMNLEGRVIGVVVSQYLGAQNLNFAVPSSAVLALLEGGRASQELERVFGTPVPFGRGALIRNLGISALLLGGIFVVLRRLR